MTDQDDTPAGPAFGEDPGGGRNGCLASRALKILVVLWLGGGALLVAAFAVMWLSIDADGYRPQDSTRFVRNHPDVIRAVGRPVEVVCRSGGTGIPTLPDAVRSAGSSCPADMVWYTCSVNGPDGSATVYVFWSPRESTDKPAILGGALQPRGGGEFVVLKAMAPE